MDAVTELEPADDHEPLQENQDLATFLASHRELPGAPQITLERTVIWKQCHFVSCFKPASCSHPPQLHLLQTDSEIAPRAS